MTCVRRPRAEAEYSTNPFAVSALQGGRWSAKQLGFFIPGKHWSTNAQEADWASGPV